MRHAYSIIFLMACFVAFVFPAIGKELFLREFLTYAYGIHLFIFVIITLAIVSNLSKLVSINTSLHLPAPITILLIWFAFVCLYPLVGIASENYYHSYLLVALLALPSLHILLKSKKIKIFHLYIPMLLYAAIQTGFVVFQSLGMHDSKSFFFSITGSNSNPNITAMSICIALPAGIEMARHYNKRIKAYLIIAMVVAMTAVIIIIQCRSALLAIFIMSIVYYIVNFERVKSRIIRILTLLLPILFIVVFIFVNHSKRTSSDSRIFIWKLTTSLIAENPLTGYGYGYFEKAYNLHQAEYFNSAHRTETERMNASFTGMAYNEYFEQSVMGGIVGGLLFLLFVLSLIRHGWKQRKETVAPLAGIICFAIMSLFNFTIAFPALFLFFLFYASIITAASNVSTNIIRKSHVQKVMLLAGIASMVFVMFSFQKYKAQQILTKADHLLRDGQRSEAGKMLRDIEPNIRTSEAYFQVLTNYNLSGGDLNKARTSLMWVLEYTSNPTNMLDLAQISAKLGNEKEAETYMLLASGIEPHLFRPRVLLMELYLHNNQNGKAKVVAKEILAMKSKVISNQVQIYKKRAVEVLTKLSPPLENWI